MKQTAVEWFEEKLEQYVLTYGNLPLNVLLNVSYKFKQQAKAMEEQQREDMYKKGWFDAIETYGGNKCQFEIHNSTSSATICKWCGKEKWQHKTYEDNQ